MTREMKAIITEALFIFHEMMKGKEIPEDMRLRIAKWRENAEECIDEPEIGDRIG